jgi:EAL domain-containing protein (putative c-di-GMP-specific phosphodiesterase class I)
MILDGESRPRDCSSIDGGTWGPANSGEDASIVRSLIAMVHNLGLRVVAEEVETEAQAAFLLKEQCEEAQSDLRLRPHRLYCPKGRKGAS